MRKLYVAPEMEIVKFTLKDVIMGSPIESSIPEQGETMPEGGELPELPDI